MKSLVIFLVIIGVAIPAGSICAADEESLISIPGITVTYTRSEEDPRKVPASIVVIEKEAIEKSGAKTIPDLLRSEAGINVRSYFGGNRYTSLDLRGFVRGMETLVMINGVRLNSVDLSAVDWSLIPLEAIERIEITKGAGTALWGDNAVAGVINIITKEGERDPYVRFGVSGGSDGEMKSSLAFGYAGEKIGLSLSGEYGRSDGYRENSSSETSAYALSVSYEPTDVLAMDLNLGASYDVYGFPGGIYREEIDRFGRRYSFWKDDEGKSEAWYAAFGMDFNFEDRNRFEIDYSYRGSKRIYENIPPSAGISALGENTNTLYEQAISGKYIGDFTGEDISNRLTIGLDFRHADFDYIVDNPYTGFGTFKANTGIVRDSLSPFFYNELTLWDDLVVSLGYRFEWVKNKFNYSEQSPWGSVPGRDSAVSYREDAFNFALTYLYGEKNKIYLRYSEGYRMPLVDEFIVFGFLNTSIKPERSREAEVGVEHSTSVFGIDLALTGAIYYQRFKNELYYDPILYMNLNYEKTVHWGLEVGVKAEVNDWLELYLSYALKESFFDYGPYAKKTMPLVPEHTLALGVGVNFGGVSLNLDGRWVSERVLENDLENQYGTLDDYFVVNARIGYEYKNLEFYFGVNNVTGEEYTDYGGYAPSSIGRGTIYEYPLPTTTFYGGGMVTF